MNRDEIIARLGDRKVVASISGGKDSAAMSLYLTELGIEHERVFLDTGWENERTYEYLRGELTRVIGPITEISAPHKMVSLVLKRGMFPSRQRRYCTQELKVFPMQRYINALVDDGEDVVNTVGIRAGESAARSKMPEWEWSNGFDCEVWRPILRWSEQDVIDIHHRHGLRPNPLYLLGAQRVGCWPCIYARKSELRLINQLAPERVDLMERLEERVAVRAAARYAEKGETFESLGYDTPSWFQDPNPKKVPCRTCGGGGLDDAGEKCPACNGRGTRRYGSMWPIRKVIEWAKTKSNRELLAAPEHEQGCMRWGLCETDAEPVTEIEQNSWDRLRARIRALGAA